MGKIQYQEGKEMDFNPKVPLKHILNIEALDIPVGTEAGCIAAL